MFRRERPALHHDLAAERGRAAPARPPVDQAALAQRARLLEAVWADARGGARSALRAMLPPGLVPPLAETDGTLDAYAVDGSLCPDGVWRVCRDDVGQHPGALLLEAPLLAVFLPALCRVLLGQTLQLPSMPAWWLGDTATRSVLMTRPHRFRLRNAFGPDNPEVVLADLSAAARCRLQHSIGPALNSYVIVFNPRLQQRRCELSKTLVAAGVTARC